MSLLANVLVFYAAAATIRDAEPFLGGMFLTIVVGVAVLQIIAIDFHFEQGIFTRISEYDRPEGWSGYPELGFLVCIEIAILVALLQTMPGGARRVVLGLVIAVSAVELILLFSRMAWVTAAAVVVLVYVAAGTPIGRSWKPAVGALVVAIIVGMATAQSTTGRNLLVSLTSANVRESSRYRERTTKMIEDHPLLVSARGIFRQS
jgi:hypothetical protein